MSETAYGASRALRSSNGPVENRSRWPTGLARLEAWMPSPPSADLARELAAEVDGHLRLLSAVAHWGWESKWPARYPQLGVRTEPRRAVEAEVHVSDVSRHDIDGWATSRVRTVLDCAAELPFDEALAVADSALRHRDVSREELEAAMGDDPQVRRVVAHATPLADNPFESVLRAILVEAGIGVVPQWETTIGRVTYHPARPHEVVTTVRAALALASPGLGAVPAA
ncbi:hypothetical protein AAII07_31015 [Microvirga sp. 0TCS3.31]